MSHGLNGVSVESIAGVSAGFYYRCECGKYGEVVESRTLAMQAHGRHALHAEQPVTISLPGAFVGYFDGSGVVQGQDYYGDRRDYAAAMLRTAYQASTPRKAGKGLAYPVTLTPALSLCILAEYAAMCIEVNEHGDAVANEKQATRKVIERVLATGRVATDDYFTFYPVER